MYSAGEFIVYIYKIKKTKKNTSHGKGKERGYMRRGRQGRGRGRGGKYLFLGGGGWSICERMQNMDVDYRRGARCGEGSDGCHKVLQ